MEPDPPRLGLELRRIVAGMGGFWSSIGLLALPLDVGDVKRPNEDGVEDVEVNVDAASLFK